MNKLITSRSHWIPLLLAALAISSITRADNTSVKEQPAATQPITTRPASLNSLTLDPDDMKHTVQELAASILASPRLQALWVGHEKGNVPPELRVLPFRNDTGMKIDLEQHVVRELAKILGASKRVRVVDEPADRLARTPLFTLRGQLSRFSTRDATRQREVYTLTLRIDDVRRNTTCYVDAKQFIKQIERKADPQGDVVQPVRPEEFGSVLAARAMEQLLKSPKVQEHLAALTKQKPDGRLPLVHLGIFRNDTPFKVSVSPTFEFPMLYHLLNSGKFEVLNLDPDPVQVQGPIDMPDLSLMGTFSQSTQDGKPRYTLTLKLSGQITGSPFEQSVTVSTDK